MLDKIKKEKYLLLKLLIIDYYKERLSNEELIVIDEYLSDHFFHNINELKYFTKDSCQGILQYLPKTNEVWNNFFDSQNLLDKLK